MSDLLMELLAVAQELRRQVCAPVSGPGSCGIGEVGTTLDKLEKLERRIQAQVPKEAPK